VIGGKIIKTLIIYASVHHNNTEKIACAMAEALNADMMRISEVNLEVLEKYDLIGFGSGIYYGKFHKSIIRLLEVLPKVGLIPKI